jgi:azurin
MRRSRLSASVSALVLLAACSGGSDGGDAAAADPIVAEDGAVTLTGTDRLRWNADAVTADTGDLTFELICEDAVNHNLVIDGEVIAECTPGDQGAGSASLEAGEHEYVCTVPGHARTMRGTLTVS